MKVLFLNLFDDPAEGGGAEMTLHHLTQRLVRRGMEPVFATIGEQPGLHRSERDGVRIWRAGLRNLYRPDLKARPHAWRARSGTCWTATTRRCTDHGLRCFNAVSMQKADEVGT